MGIVLDRCYHHNFEICNWYVIRCSLSLSLSLHLSPSIISFIFLSFFLTLLHVGAYRYKSIRDAVFKTSLYRQRLRKILQELQIAIPKVKRKAVGANIDDEQEDWVTEELARQALGDDLGIGGVRKPTWRDLFVLDVLMFPCRFGRFVYDSCRTLTPDEQDSIDRRRMNFDGKSDEEWRQYKAHQMRLARQINNSNRAKIAKRYWKKHDPVAVYADE
jgi:hypothetical protein